MSLLGTKYFQLSLGIVFVLRTCVSCRYGWANMRNVASLISGVGIFCIGSGLSIYHGIEGLIHPDAVESLYWVRVSSHCPSTTALKISLADALMNRIGVQHILSVKVPVTIDTMLNFDGDFDGSRLQRFGSTNTLL